MITVSRTFATEDDAKRWLELRAAEDAKISDGKVTDEEIAKACDTFDAFNQSGDRQAYVMRVVLCEFLGGRRRLAEAAELSDEEMARKLMLDAMRHARARP